MITSMKELSIRMETLYDDYAEKLCKTQDGTTEEAEIVGMMEMIETLYADCFGIREMYKCLIIGRKDGGHE